jgi:hypothetical protein
MIGTSPVTLTSQETESFDLKPESRNLDPFGSGLPQELIKERLTNETSFNGLFHIDLIEMWV